MLDSEECTSIWLPKTCSIDRLFWTFACLREAENSLSSWETLGFSRRIWNHLINRSCAMEMARILTQNPEQNLPNTATLREADAGTSLATAAPTRRIRMKAFIVTEKRCLLSVSFVRRGNWLCVKMSPGLNMQGIMAASVSAPNGKVISRELTILRVRQATTCYSGQHFFILLSFKLRSIIISL
jgi:hypothetical protein